MAAASLTGAAAAGLVVGVNDDAAKDPAAVGWFYPTMGSEGLQLSTLSLRWDDTSPTTVPDQAAVNRAIAAAKANGQTVELDLFPLHSKVFTDGSKCAPSTDPQGCGDTAQIQAFAAWTAQVAGAFPTVHQYVVMNECNQPLFVNPQFDASGAEPVGRDLRPRARRRLRRAQGRRAARTSSGASGSRRAATTTRTRRATSRPRRPRSCGISAPGSRRSQPRPGAHDR